jgi:nicotinate phosphoribosyltransferase
MQMVSPLYTDLYQLTMAQSYFKNRMHNHRAVFDFFFRKIPFNGGYVVFAGISELMGYIKELRFSENDLLFLEDNGFEASFLEFLKGFSFKGNISGVREGDVIFPFEPVIRVEGTLLETQLIETLLLNQVNFQSLIATKAARIRYVAGNRHLSEFGLRRAQSFGALHASRASIIGGFDSTSNVLAAKKYNIPSAGTMAHSFIQSFDDELSAFRAYSQSFPDQCTLLVDTYNTLYSGIPNAVKIAHEMKQKGQSLKAIRLDSGDLAYLSRKAREILDYENLPNVKIVVSNQLDEYVIKSLIDQKAPIDIFGVGTSLVTGQPDAAMDGVYKLSVIESTPALKISDNLQKTTLPGRKKIMRFFDRNGMFYADAVMLQEETELDHMSHPFEKFKSLNLKDLKCEELFVNYMKEGEVIIHPENPIQINKRLRTRLNLLPVEHQRFDYPHIYKVGISEKLMNLRDNLLKKHNRV